jgi:hypothetical protein
MPLDHAGCEASQQCLESRSVFSGVWCRSSNSILNVIIRSAIGTPNNEKNKEKLSRFSQKLIHTARRRGGLISLLGVQSRIVGDVGTITGIFQLSLSLNYFLDTD